VLACDTPDNLKRDFAPDCLYRIETPLLSDGHNPLDGLPVIRSVALEHRGDRGRTHIRVILQDEHGITTVTDRLRERGVQSLVVSRLEPTLEDAFLNLVGHGLSNGSEESEGLPS